MARPKLDGASGRPPVCPACLRLVAVREADRAVDTPGPAPRREWASPRIKEVCALLLCEEVAC